MSALISSTKKDDSTQMASSGSSGNGNGNGSNDTNSNPEAMKGFEALDKATRQRVAIEKIQQYRKIIVEGCGDWLCSNPDCFSNTGKSYSERDASLLALTSWKERRKECEEYPRKSVAPLLWSELQQLNNNTKVETRKRVLRHLLKALEYWDDVLTQSFRSGQKITESQPDIVFEELDRVFEWITSNENDGNEDDWYDTNDNNNQKEEENGLLARCNSALSRGIDRASEQYGSNLTNLLSLRNVLIMLENPLVISEDPTTRENAHKLCAMIASFDDATKKKLEYWLSQYTDLNRLRVILSSLQQQLTIEIVECEDEIANLTEDWQRELSADADAEDVEQVVHTIRDRQREHREQVVTDKIVPFVKVIDILWQANERIIAESMELDDLDDNEYNKSTTTYGNNNGQGVNRSTPPTDTHDDNKSSRNIQVISSSGAGVAATTTTGARAGMKSDDIQKIRKRRLISPNFKPAAHNRGLNSRSPSIQPMDLDGNNTVEVMDIDNKTNPANTGSNNNEDKNATDVKTETNQEEGKEEFHRRLSLAGISTIRKPLSLDLYHNSGLNETLCEKDSQRGLIHQYDFWYWKEKTTFSYLQYPYLLDAGSKARYLEYENRHRQQLALRSQVVRMFLEGVNSPDQLMERLDLVLRVRRTHLIEDTLPILQIYSSKELKRRLRIIFEGEQGVDQGGLTKEFFQLIIKELFDPKFGMFKYNDKTQTYWFNRDSLDSDAEYKLIGVLIGIAIYNNTILDFRFPKVIFKKLLDKPIDFDDFRDFDPEMAKGFEQLLQFEGDVESTYCRTFSVSYSYYGEQREDDLKENGHLIALTNENREEYVDLYVRYLLEECVKLQFESFCQGFKTVCDSELFTKFTCDELELLICGNREFDFENLEFTCRYENGFTKQTPLIKQFWSIVHKLSEEDKRKLLSFCTGSDRVPIRGLGDLQLTIAKNGTDDAQLPTSHTCFNHILLPEYSNTEILRERLLTAIQNSEGFGLLEKKKKKEIIKKKILFFLLSYFIYNKNIYIIIVIKKKKPKRIFY